MQKLILSTIIIAIIQICNVYAWEHHCLPGGTPLKVIIVDNDSVDVEGAWVCERAGGMYWMDWDGFNYGEYVEFLPFEGIWSGNTSYINGELITCAGANSGIFTSTHNGISWNQFEQIPNNYYRFHDAACWGYNPLNGNYLYVVPAMQVWEPQAGMYIKGLYLIEGNDPLPPGSIPISGDQPQDYSFIYQDLEPGFENIFYTKCSTPGVERLQRLTSSGVYPDWAGTIRNDDFENSNVRSVVGKVYRDTIPDFELSPEKLIETTVETFYTDSYVLPYENNYFYKVTTVN